MSIQNGNSTTLLKIIPSDRANVNINIMAEVQVYYQGKETQKPLYQVLTKSSSVQALC